MSPLTNPGRFKMTESMWLPFIGTIRMRVVAITTVVIM